MRVITSIATLRKTLHSFRKKGCSIGFVPTMGFFHEGHLSLMRRSVTDNDVTVVSIFVNPLQFGPSEDFANYPRDKKNDEKLARKEKVDIIFCPSTKEMYPQGLELTVNVGSMADRLCGLNRPGHFDGVATIVAKLLNIVNPDVFYLGQKDAQQVAILTKMIANLNFSARVKILPTVRESDGLAMSSRNVYLNSRQRQEAAILYQTLKWAGRQVKNGSKDVRSLIQNMRNRILKNSDCKIDYIECVNAQTLMPLKTCEGQVLIAIAVKFGQARLIDNIIVRIP